MSPPQRAAARHLIETMRRGGCELTYRAARGLQGDLRRSTARAHRGSHCRVDEQYSGVVVQKLSERRGTGRDAALRRRAQRLVFHVPTRGCSLSKRIAVRHPRHWRDEPSVS